MSTVDRGGTILFLATMFQATRNRYTVGVEHLDEGCVSKYFGDSVLPEYEKACALYETLQGTVFAAPRPLRCDTAGGRVEYELLADRVLLEELCERAHDTKQYDRVVRLNDAAAELLAVLHQRLRLADAERWQPPDYLVQRAASLGYGWSDDESDDVFLHCDYSPVNLLVNSADEIAVIDPSPNAYFTQAACLKGHRLVDVASYTAKLFCPFHWRTFSLSWRRAAGPLRRRFVDEYQRHSGAVIDERLLCAFEYAVSRSFVEWKTDRRPVRWAAMMLSHLGMYHPGSRETHK